MERARSCVFERTLSVPKICMWPHVTSPLALASAPAATLQIASLLSGAHGSGGGGGGGDGGGRRGGGGGGGAAGGDGHWRASGEPPQGISSANAEA